MPRELPKFPFRVLGKSLIYVNNRFVCPFHYQVYRREGASWFVIDPVRMFYNPTNTPTAPEDLTYIERQYGLTAHQVAIELFRINGGKPGYYLVNLRDRKYYYCGSDSEDIKCTLQQLGIDCKNFLRCILLILLNPLLSFSNEGEGSPVSWVRVLLHCLEHCVP